MSKLLMTVFCFLLTINSFGQSVLGKIVSDVAKDFDSYYVFRNAVSNLHRTVFVRGMDEKAEYLYTYSNAEGVIKIQLDKSMSFPDQNYYGSIDTTAIESDANFINGYAVIAGGTGAGFSYGSEKLGIIDSTGKVVVEPRYFRIGKFSEGLAAYSELIGDGVESGYINTMGMKEIVLPEVLSKLYMGCYFKGGEFKNGVALMHIVENGHDCNCFSIIVINRQGKILNQEGAVLDADYKKVSLD